MRTRSIACGLALWLGGAATVLAQTTAVGDWHGVLQSPLGPMTLIVSVTEGEAGALRGHLESPDQGPGRTPLTTVAVTGGRLAFTVTPAQISYEGEWVADAQHWSGAFVQGIRMPLILTRGLPPPRPVIEGLDGVWEGAIRRNGVDLRLRLRILTTARGTIVTLDSPDQGAAGVPVTELSRQGQTIGFFVPVSGGRFTGTLADDGPRVSGTWTIPGETGSALTFTRTRAPGERAAARPRPQTPAPPFAYRVEEVTIENPAAPGVSLAGTLTLPPGPGPFPAAILITGSGPQDRDETLFGHKPFAVLADHLTRHGIAVLRHDDRGVGKSTGDFAAATTADYATDVTAAVRLLLARPEIDHRAIGLIGHSEGGMVAPIAAAGNDAVRFLVLLAAPGTNLVRLMQSQQRLIGMSQGASEEELARMEPVMAEAFTAIAASADADTARARVRAILTAERMATLRAPEQMREPIVERLTSPWFHWFLRYQPADTLSRLTVPVLAVNGSLDRQVPADENLAAIEAALTRSPDVTIRKLERLNHLFQPATTGAIGEYADIAETMAPVVLDLVTAWIQERFARPN